MAFALVGSAYAAAPSPSVWTRSAAIAPDVQNPQAGIDASGNAVVVSAPGADLKTIVGGTRALRAQGWLATTIAPPEGRSRGAGELAVGPSGDVVLLATVLRQECNSYRDNCHRAVQAFSRSPSGEWSPPLDISNPAVDAFRHGGGGDFPSAAVDATGGAVAAWISWDGNANSLLVATRARRGEGWSSPVWMWGQGISGLQTAANAAGSAILAFTTYDGVESTIRVARRPSTTAGWLASEQLGSGTVSAVTQANVGSDGRALVAWCSYQGFDLPRLFGAALFDGRSWSTKELPAFGDCASSSPQLALQPGGRVMAVWKNDDRKLVAASSSDLGTWSTPLVISVWRLCRSRSRHLAAGVLAAGTNVGPAEEALGTNLRRRRLQVDQVAGGRGRRPGPGGRGLAA